MIMGFLGLFSLSLTAAPKTTHIHKSMLYPKNFVKGESEQAQINKIIEKLIEMEQSQNYMISDLTKHNCELGRLENKINSKEPVFIETPEGLYVRQNGKLILVRKAEKPDSVIDMISAQPSKESIENERLKLELKKLKEKNEMEADFPEPNKLEKNEIFPEIAQSPEEHMKKAAEAKAKAEVAKEKVVESVNKGADEAKAAEEPKLDNHKPKPDVNLKKQASNELNKDQYIIELARDHGYQL